MVYLCRVHPFGLFVESGSLSVKTILFPRMLLECGGSVLSGLETQNWTPNGRKKIEV